MPEVVSSLAQWRERLDDARDHGARIGLTMTMGALHAGHRSLFVRAAAECDLAVASIFVNPLQFNDPGDLARYPRDLDGDLALAEAAGVRLVLAPPVHEVWPSWPDQTPTAVSVRGLTEHLEGADRPGHFNGVATIVAKVLIATGPCAAYFGEKDFQQLCVVRQMVADLAVPATIIGGAIVRDDDGLAMSSRNARLTADGRRAARCLPRALANGRDALERGEDPATAEAVMRHAVSAEPSVALAYAAVVEPATLRTPATAPAGTSLRLLIAGIVDGVRLIDNVEAVVGVPA